MRKTHNCGELNIVAKGQEVVLMGWVQRRRDHGGVIFVDLRDKDGITQVIFNPELNTAVHKKAHGIRNEYVLGIRGIVEARPDGMINPALQTGEIEIRVTELKILNEAQTPPFSIEDDTDASELVRLKYRHLDLRRPILQQNLFVRHKTAQIVRQYLNEHGFLEIETPMLTRSTPEGARDYLVPSRVNPGCFYALPQSPQLFKQLLMVAGMDRYYQIVKCFRDEDLRADRQPEFTQIDLEMSFAGEEDVMNVAEGAMRQVFRELMDMELPNPFPRMKHIEAMDRYGLDKPDTRFGLELKEVSDIVKNSGFQVFSGVVQKGGIVKAINAKGCADMTRKELDDLTEFAAIYKAKGLAWIKVKEDEWQSPIIKFFTDDEKQKLAQAIEMEPGDLVLFVADIPEIANEALGQIRNRLGIQLGLIDENQLNFLWVTEFPLMTYDIGEKRYQALHHPFTAPFEEDYALLESKPDQCRSRAYDLVLNGSEIGGGSIRVHQTSLQKRIFTALGMSKEEYEEKFGFLLNALDSGAPPHGGLAFGFDRLIAMIRKQTSIRDVIAFPKTQRAADLLTEAPSKATKSQLEELHIRVVKTEGI